MAAERLHAQHTGSARRPNPTPVLMEQSSALALITMRSRVLLVCAIATQFSAVATHAPSAAATPRGAAYIVQAVRLHDGAPLFKLDESSGTCAVAVRCI